MNKTVQPQWLEWAKELQFIAQGGLTYSKDVFDIERFERIREIAAEMLSLQSEIPIEKVKNLFCNETGFQTPKLDTRAAIFKDDKILLVKEKNGAAMSRLNFEGRRKPECTDITIAAHAIA